MARARHAGHQLIAEPKQINRLVLVDIDDGERLFESASPAEVERYLSGIALHATEIHRITPPTSRTPDLKDQSAPPCSDCTTLIPAIVRSGFPR